MRRRPLFVSCIVFCAVLVPWAAAAQVGKGDVVAVTGRVSDAAGRPLADLEVILEVSRDKFRLTRLKRERGNTLEVPAVTDADGGFHLDWHWDPFYNAFAAVVALPVRKDGRDDHEIFLRREVTAEMTSGQRSVRLDLVLPDTTRLDELRAFLSSLQSDDEKRVYHEMGLPDRVDLGEESYDPDRSFWYFAAGKVFRFRDGELEEEVGFEPVPGADDPGGDPGGP